MKLIIVGNGGHSQVVQDLILELNDHTIIAVLDDQILEGYKLNNILYESTLKLPVLYQDEVQVVIAVGDNSTRKKLAEKFNLPPEAYATLVHPSAFVSKQAVLGHGTVVMANAVINAGSLAGNHVIINSGAIVEHECKLEHYVHLSPNATLTGNVSLKEGVHIGAGATLIPKVTVGEWSVAGAGAVVTKSIPSFQTAVGCPARLTRKIERIS
ncbi:acetyltransferase [Jeotgalibacillus proteolyticus]|uniref:Acetyltransferase n=1 Tax=Jeotgalibacillus proteolyticus TaxID=2082395 RepID=A0A2S5G8G8_9BACL|nr:acetyltransferase [Jeotgalibacillus proteolyticus]PPA69235.1 acetyltransferase [Jeotgalibacillus proteolyticus]